MNSDLELGSHVSSVFRGLTQWCIAKNGGGYTQTGVAKGLKVPYLFMIAEVSIRCQKTRRLVYTVYPRIPPPQYTTAHAQSQLLDPPLETCYTTYPGARA